VAAEIFIERRTQRLYLVVAGASWTAESIMIISPGWHPLIVHFPLALILVATLLLFGARVVRSQTLAATLATVGTWNLCIGAFAAVFALGSGLAAVLDLDVSMAARQAISVHLKWAMFTTLALLLLAVWRGAGTAPGSRPSWVFIIVLLAATLALVVTGYHGGKNVYEYGIGVKKIAVRPTLAPHGVQINREFYCAGISPV
jgi:uncharacterized membrane protein